MGQKNNASATTSATGVPKWMKPGTGAYNAQNSFLRAAPIGAVNSVIKNGGMTQAGNQAIKTLQGLGSSNANMNAAGDVFRGMANGQGASGTARYEQLYNAAGQPGAAEKYLTGTAQGQYLNSNPYIEDMISAGASDVANSVTGQFAAGGRYGSTANQGAIADSVSQYGNQLRNSNYQAERDRMMSAAGALEGAQNTGFAQQAGLAQNITGVEQANAGLQQAGASALGTLGQQQMSNAQNNATGAANVAQQGMGNLFSAIGALPTVQANKLYDANAQGAVGSQIDNRTQQALMDKIKQLGALDMQDWSAIGALLGAGQQSAGSYGTQTGTQTTSGGGNIFGALGGIGSLFSGIGGLFSDRRLKRHIAHVGEEKGFPIYEFSYKGRPDRRFRGVMAQDVMETRPDAVRTYGGVLVVDYDAIGVKMTEV